MTEIRDWDLLTDERSRNAVEVAERFANGDATEAELSAAWAAGQDAALAAAWDAAWASVRDAARVASDAARAAAANQLRVMVPNPFVGNEVV